ncbi:MAG: type IVB secretion system lipoprotein DotD [Francisellaceae bacterium]|jgi:defect in organelle trafficking protein DotD|nr:type IVB secretion system lipoprotein DotD [Francisellaceae bacterium]MBT6206905.1 type IVB secretion system lipoprotein DotD [Francisellaceae bacterium]MBT6538276.1 type IVB secretion system lipoprotein DotD [Francisellaceae bacterium]
MSRLVFTLSAAVLLSGCAIFDKDYQKPVTDLPPSKRLENELSAAAQSIERSLNVLAAGKLSEQPGLIDTAPLVTPEGGMGGSVNLDWVGPIAPLLQKMAEISNYRLKILGKEPSIPVLVSITNKTAVVADVIKNASLQAKSKASIMVFPESKVIELRYTPNKT